ncbi:MAG: S-methyl-5'-thioadenosine phosphorylase, partial [Deltaproteobacteria bacterium]|nr:S-methyl-5'-thioadenosine phosphorylase [Deltaproteobacteria bacterium]
MNNKCVGVIGGVGLYEMEGLSNIKEVKIETPFGDPSDLFIVGELNGVKMVFLPRHGREHTISPSEINSRANIYGMKQLGVEWIIGVSAVGSLKEDIMPGEILIVNQYVDRTRGRISTFFTDGIVAHVSMADPTCPVLNKLLLEAGKKAVDVTIHPKGTYLCMEGPQFSTRAESNIYRMWGLDVIGMTNMPEAKLAREAEICYSTIAIIT